jgi:hypothetical protein
LSLTSCAPNAAGRLDGDVGGALRDSLCRFNGKPLAAARSSVYAKCCYFCFPLARIT